MESVWLAEQGHQFIGTPLDLGGATNRFETIGIGLQGVADLLGDGDLAFDGQGCCHGCTSRVLLLDDGIASDSLGQGVFQMEQNGLKRQRAASLSNTLRISGDMSSSPSDWDFSAR